MPQPDPSGRLVPGTDRTRQVAAAGGRARAAAAAARRLDRAVNDLIAAAPKLSQAQRGRLAAAFCTGQDQA